MKIILIEKTITKCISESDINNVIDLIISITQRCIEKENKNCGDYNHLNKRIAKQITSRKRKLRV